MSQLEPIQFQVTLTKNKEILLQLRKNKMEREDKLGRYFSIQFDGQEFKFRPGQVFTVGKTVGNALIRSSAVLLGNDPLSDPYVAFVEKVGESLLGQATSKKPQFECPICHTDQKTQPKLARHLMDKNAHKEMGVEEEEEVETEKEEVEEAVEVDQQKIETTEGE